MAETERGSTLLDGQLTIALLHLVEMSSIDVRELVGGIGHPATVDGVEDDDGDDGRPRQVRIDINSAWSMYAQYCTSLYRCGQYKHHTNRRR
jgi:hypothetical protein